MRITKTYTTATAADVAADPQKSLDSAFILFENVTGFLENIQHTRTSGAEVDDAATVSAFVPPDTGLLAMTGAEGNLLSPRLLEQGADGADLETTTRLYLSGDILAVIIDDSAAEAGGGKSGTVTIRLSNSKD